MKGSSNHHTWRSVAGLGMAAVWLLPWLGCAARPTSFDSDEISGFEIFRSGRLDEGGLGTLCDAGVTEIVVMDGSASSCALVMTPVRVVPTMRPRWL